MSYHHREQLRRWFWCRVCRDWRKSDKGQCPTCKGPDAAFYAPFPTARNTTPY